MPSPRWLGRRRGLRRQLRQRNPCAVGCRRRKRFAASPRRRRQRLGGRWHVFDPRNNQRRIGRILIATGRDAADVPLTHTFGANNLAGFKVWTDPLP